MDTLTTCHHKVVSDQEIEKQKFIGLQKKVSEEKSDQEMCSMESSESLQKLNST